MIAAAAAAKVGRCRLTVSKSVLTLDSVFWLQRLKLQYDETLSNSPFNLNLRRYTKRKEAAEALAERREAAAEQKAEREAGPARHFSSSSSSCYNYHPSSSFSSSSSSFSSSSSASSSTSSSLATSSSPDIHLVPSYIDFNGIL